MEYVNVDKLADLCSRLDKCDEVVSGKINLFSEKVRPIVAWFLRTGTLGEHDLDMIVKTVKEFDEYIIYVAYDCLPPGLRDLVRNKNNDGSERLD